MLPVCAPLGLGALRWAGTGICPPQGQNQPGLSLFFCAYPWPGVSAVHTVHAARVACSAHRQAHTNSTQTQLDQEKSPRLGWTGLGWPGLAWPGASWSWSWSWSCYCCWCWMSTALHLSSSVRSLSLSLSLCKSAHTASALLRSTPVATTLYFTSPRGNLPPYSLHDLLGLAGTDPNPGLFSHYALSHHCLRYLALTCVVPYWNTSSDRTPSRLFFTLIEHDDLLTSHRLVSELRIPCPAPPTIHPSIGTHTHTLSHSLTHTTHTLPTPIHLYPILPHTTLIQFALLLSSTQLNSPHCARGLCVVRWQATSPQSSCLSHSLTRPPGGPYSLTSLTLPYGHPEPDPFSLIGTHQPLGQASGLVSQSQRLSPPPLPSTYYNCDLFPSFSNLSNTLLVCSPSPPSLCFSSSVLQARRTPKDRGRRPRHSSFSFPLPASTSTSTASTRIPLCDRSSSTTRRQWAARNLPALTLVALPSRPSSTTNERHRTSILDGTDTHTIQHAHSTRIASPFDDSPSFAA